MMYALSPKADAVTVAKRLIAITMLNANRTTAFACRYKNKPYLNELRMCHRNHSYGLTLSYSK